MIGILAKASTALACFMLFIMVMFILCHWRFNISSSMPYGIYQKQTANEIQRGDIVAVCLDSTWQALGRQRGYLGRGICAFHSSPLVKRVIAGPGDVVRVSEKGIIVNHQFYPAPHYKRDKNHQRLSYPFAFNQAKRTQGYWLYGEMDHHHSWDSRYFGAVKLKNIIGKYRPILTWRRKSPGEWFSPTVLPNKKANKKRQTALSPPLIRKIIVLSVEPPPIFSKLKIP